MEIKDIPWVITQKMTAQELQLLVILLRSAGMSPIMDTESSLSDVLNPKWNSTTPAYLGGSRGGIFGIQWGIHASDTVVTYDQLIVILEKEILVSTNNQNRIT